MYVACIEVKPLEGCQIDPQEYDGAAVRCYIPALTESDAAAMLLESLESHRLELVETEFLVEQGSVEWQYPDDPTAEELRRAAAASGEVEYGEFRAWSDDEQ